MHVNTAALESNSRIRAKWQEELALFNRYNRRRSDVEELRFNLSHDIDWLLRFPIPGDVMYPVEKIDQEVAVMEFIREKTSIPIPKVIASGRAEGRFAGLGSFIIMEFVDGERLDEALYQNDEIKPGIGQPTLDFIYKQMAQIYLELFEHDFDQIGGLSMPSGGRSWHIRDAPLTLKMNEGQRLTGIHLNDHCEPYTTTEAYLDNLVDQHTRLLCENPESVSDEEECYEQYRCLQTIKMLTKLFVGSVDCNGPFKLFLDDIRFGNILVDPKTFEIKALIDWEFCYTAPREFLNAPPPWLIPNPDPWDWKSEEREAYKVQFLHFTKVLEDEESKSGKDHSFSAQMRNQHENGTFWYLQAMREPLCCLELMQSWSAEVGQPLDTPVDITKVVEKRFQTQTALKN
ncbi:hypothetical protein V500_05492 [Pseudogymnoascus sp. VKM F-4518 (FW-2643)]|nr:hypothetical protein V500_05492 [Pseudogymnoascus sp. VKM F-4518 (FW-2643)]